MIMFFCHLPSWATKTQVVMFILFRIALKLAANGSIHSWSLAPKLLLPR